MSSQIDHLLDETRQFPPSEEFVAQSVSSARLYENASTDREAFWADQSRELLEWHKPFTRVLDWSTPPFAKWFDDGELNVAYDCLDRHVEAGNGDRVAYHWRGEEGEERDVTYADLHRDVQRLANALKDLGVGKGDVVGIYLPMIPEVAVAMLACARIGAPHNVVFGGFSAQSLADRIDDADCKVVITADAGWRRGKQVKLKALTDEALTLTDRVEHCVVVRRMGDAMDH